MTPILRILFLASLASAAPACAQERRTESFWILHEQARPDPSCAEAASCPALRSYESRPFEPGETATVRRLFATMRHASHLAAPQICDSGAPSAAPDLGDLEALPMAEKGATLKGLTQVGFDATRISAPPGLPDTFGADLHDAFVRILGEAGLEVVTPEEAAALPGAPQLSLSASFGDPADACGYRYSGFASLTQTAVMTRDPSLKVRAGSWSMSIKGAGMDEPRQEAGKLHDIAAALADAWRDANGIVPPPDQ
ncbi:hypothetical protein RM543_10775 [Roseicyclus sp. F158]|uniref:Uncharacterized protein n=1 Tax=Tropicimonas omnivorans TaxID=3075590 RepID=A0ABU3DHI6_9RHOB|nr:hypothetical protein [Roseicyclus sp. F158]MDT0683171.1 hypothetical protein [Roseicyclus sp. F158]